MISKELKSQLSILKETNPEYIQTLKVKLREILEVNLRDITIIDIISLP